jgi:hypothetical protein
VAEAKHAAHLFLPLQITPFSDGQHSGQNRPHLISTPAGSGLFVVAIELDSEMPLAARLFIALLFILAVIGLWRLPRSDGSARPPIKFAVSANWMAAEFRAANSLGMAR